MVYEQNKIQKHFTQRAIRQKLGWQTETMSLNLKKKYCECRGFLMKQGWKNAEHVSNNAFHVCKISTWNFVSYWLENSILYKENMHKLQ
jgi:hypothetical protein